MDQIESYLDEVSHRLRVSVRDKERLLSELGEHLQDAAAAEQAAGSDIDTSQARAIARTGGAREVAAAANAGATRGAVVFAAAQLAVLGSTAMLLGVLLSQVLARVATTTWVFGLPAQARPSDDEVAHWLQVHPGAQGWRQAAALENASDSLTLRGGFALSVLMAALVFILFTRHRLGRLAQGTVQSSALAAFGLVMLLLTLGGLAGLDLLDWGRGQWFSDAAAVALVMAATFGTQRARRRLAPPVWTPRLPFRAPRGALRLLRPTDPQARAAFGSSTNAPR